MTFPPYATTIRPQHLMKCGLFAVVFATELVFSISPGHISFVQKELRAHMLKCLQQQNITRFPRTDHRVKFCKSEVHTFVVYCICRQPFLKMYMAECSSCSEWFHRRCMNIPVAIFQKKLK